jgi:uncharacterized protein
MNTGRSKAINAVIDTNVYISAVLFGGNSETIIEAGRDGQIELLVSPHIITEITDILRKKFNWPHLQISEVMDDVRDTAVIVTPAESVRVIKEDKSDNRILECAVEGRADYIISGDVKHLQSLKAFRGIPILSPAEYVKHFLK